MERIDRRNATSRDILILVKTYPTPSQRHRETVCTAGMTRDGKWVRLYPIDFRTQDPNKKFRKFEWVRVETVPRANNYDPRPESHTPLMETLETLDHVGTGSNWSERKRLVDMLPCKPLHEFKDDWHANRTSLGVVRPDSIIDLELKHVGGEWTEKQRGIVDQLTVPFDNVSTKRLRKIPYKFVFHFYSDGQKHQATCTDWEMSMRFLKGCSYHSTERDSAEEVRRHYLKLFDEKHLDARFFMGTMHKKNSWIAVGVFAPPDYGQGSLGLF